MSNVILKMNAMSNISYDREVDTYIPVEDWNEMSRTERIEVMSDALWDDIEVSAVNEDTGEYLD